MTLDANELNTARRPKCSVEGCLEPEKTRGWCRTHYARWYHTGDVRAHIPIGISGSGRKRLPRVPTEPLRELLESRRLCTGAKTLNDLSNHIGIDSTKLWRVVKADDMTIWEADRLACALGTHPMLVWGSEWPEPEMPEGELELEWAGVN